MKYLPRLFATLIALSISGITHAQGWMDVAEEQLKRKQGANAIQNPPPPQNAPAPQQLPQSGYQGFYKPLQGTSMDRFDSSDIPMMQGAPPPPPTAQKPEPYSSSNYSENMGQSCCPAGYYASWNMCYQNGVPATESRVFTVGTYDSRGVCTNSQDATGYLTGN